MDGRTPTIFEVAEQAARKRPSARKPARRRPHTGMRRKQSERGSGRVRKGAKGKRKGRR